MRILLDEDFPKSAADVIVVALRQPNRRAILLAEFDLKRMSDFVRANGGTLMDDADCGKLEFAARLPRKLVDELARHGEVRAIHRISADASSAACK